MSPARLTLYQIRPEMQTGRTKRFGAVRRVFARGKVETESIKSSTSVIIHSLREEIGERLSRSGGGVERGVAGSPLKQEQAAIKDYRSRLPKKIARIDEAIETAAQEELRGIEGEDLGKMQMVYGAKFADAERFPGGGHITKDVLDVTLSSIADVRIAAAGEDGRRVLGGRLAAGIKILASDASEESKRAAISILDSTKKQSMLMLLEEKQEKLRLLEKKRIALENIESVTTPPQRSRVKAFEKAVGRTGLALLTQSARSRGDEARTGARPKTSEQQPARMTSTARSSQATGALPRPASPLPRPTSPLLHSAHSEETIHSAAPLLRPARAAETFRHAPTSPRLAPSSRPSRSSPPASPTALPEHSFRSSPPAQSLPPAPTPISHLSTPQMQSLSPQDAVSESAAPDRSQLSDKWSFMADVSYQELADAALGYVRCLNLSQDCNQQDDWFLEVLRMGAEAMAAAGEPQAKLGESILQNAVRLAKELQQAQTAAREELEIQTSALDSQQEHTAAREEIEIQAGALDSQHAHTAAREGMEIQTSALESSVENFSEINNFLASWNNIDGRRGAMNEEQIRERYQDIVNKLAYLHLSELTLEEVNSLTKVNSRFIDTFAERRTGREKSMFIEALSTVGMVKANRQINRMIAGGSMEGVPFHNYCQGEAPLEELQETFLLQFGKVRERLVVPEEAIDQVELVRALVGRESLVSFPSLTGEDVRLRTRRLDAVMRSSEAEAAGEVVEARAEARATSEVIEARAASLLEMTPPEVERANTLPPGARLAAERESADQAGSTSELTRQPLEPEVNIIPPPPTAASSEQSVNNLVVSEAQLRAVHTAADKKQSSDVRMQAIYDAGMVGESRSATFGNDLPRADFVFNAAGLTLASEMGGDIKMRLSDGMTGPLCKEEEKGGSGRQFGKGFLAVQQFLMDGIEKLAPQRYTREDRTRLANCITSISNQSMLGFSTSVGLQSQAEIERTRSLPYPKTIISQKGGDQRGQNTSYEVTLTPNGCRINGRCRVEASLLVAHGQKGGQTMVPLDRNRSYYEANVFVEADYDELLSGPRSDGKTKVWHSYEGVIFPAPETATEN